MWPQRNTPVLEFMGDEKTLSRAADLKVHCGTAHRLESLEVGPTFFTSSNAFYLSRFPDDYRRIASVAPFMSPEAINARRLVEIWTRTLPSPDLKLVHWKAGWMGAMEGDCKKRKREDSPIASDIGEEPDIELEEVALPKSRRVVEKSLPSAEDPKETESKRAASEERTTESIPEKSTTRRDEIQDTNTDLEYIYSSEDEAPIRSEMDVIKEKEKTLQREIEDIQIKLNTKEQTEKPLTKRTESRKETLQKRAENILKIGAMPLCPPGRRDWKDEGVLDLEIGSRTLQWPPRNFKDMSPDERLLPWVYVAMTIEHEARGQFPSVSRQVLLDTYNLLALPGTRKAYDCQDKACRKVRFYNYQLVRAVAQGSITSSEGQDLVKSLELIQAAQRKTMAMGIAAKLDSINVKLRLEN